MKENEGLYRAARFLRRLVIGAIALVTVVLLVGYLFLVRQVDPGSAWSYAQREVDGGILHYGERAIRIARVYQRRPTNYFRAANGLLVATPERVIFVGVEPRDKLAGADAPAAILTQELRNDTTLAAATQRIYSLTAHGIVLTQGKITKAYAASRGHEDELDSLASYVLQRQREERAAAAQSKKLRDQLAALLKQPLHYVVERGDAISTIASRYGATADQIREWNHLSSDRVRVGQVLLVRPGR
jgi:LysM repeat protein